MVKMMTTEPSVELKLKKGGAVKKADGGFMGMPSGTPSSMSSSIARGGMTTGMPPGKPSLKDRRKAMMAKMASRSQEAQAVPPPSPMGMPTMKKGGKTMKKAEGGDVDMAQDKAMIKKAFKQHDSQEHKGGKGTNLSLKKGGKAYATGGVVKGQAGFKDGGSVPFEKFHGTSSKKDGTKVNTAKNDLGYEKYAKGGSIIKSDKDTMSTVSTESGGKVHTAKVNPGYEVYKKGGAAKKAFAAGGKVESGSPAAMPQGNKKPQPPIRINELTGVYRKGGSVKKMADGGDASTDDPIINREMARRNAEKASIASDNQAMSDTITGAPSRWFESAKRFLKPTILPSGSVTKTEKSVTVSPNKKRGGKV
jgi:hypothetical protein